MPENDGPHFQDYAFDPKLNKGRGRKKELLRMFPDEDLQDIRGFLSGFQIKNTRTGYGREVPEWACTRVGIQEVLLRAFPRLQTDVNQRKHAGRWAQIINLYFLQGWSAEEVAEELGQSRASIKMLVMGIDRTSRGLTVNGTVRLG